MSHAELHHNALLTADQICVGHGSYVYGGGVWVHDARDPAPGGAWHLFRLRWAVSPEMITAVDPAAVDLVRLDAVSLLDAFPDTVQRLTDLGCDHVKLAYDPITDADGVAAWTYSIYNAAVPAPLTAGAEQYPHQVLSAAALVPPPFCVVHPDEEGHVAVLPADGGRTRIFWASPGTTYSQRSGALLGPRHPVSRAAWSGRPSTPEEKRKP